MFIKGPFKENFVENFYRDFLFQAAEYEDLEFPDGERDYAVITQASSIFLRHTIVLMLTSEITGERLPRVHGVAQST